MNKLEKVFKCNDLFLQTNKNQACLSRLWFFSVVIHGCEKNRIENILMPLNSGVFESTLNINNKNLQ